LDLDRSRLRAASVRLTHRLRVRRAGRAGRGPTVRRIRMANNTHSAGRRRFLKGAAVGAAGALVPSGSARATSASAQQAPQSRSVPASPDSAQLLADTAPPPARENPRLIEHPASDFMVDVIKSLGFEYVAANP